MNAMFGEKYPPTRTARDFEIAYLTALFPYAVMNTMITRLQQQPLYFLTPLKVAAVLLAGYFLYFMLVLYSSEGRSFVVAGVLLLGAFACLAIDWIIKKMVRKTAYIWIIEGVLILLFWMFVLPPGTINTRDVLR